VMATRNSATGMFDTPGAMVGGLLSGMNYCTLTGDELTIYCEYAQSGMQSQLWQATRPDLTAAFSAISLVPDIDDNDGSVELSDPSITPDGTWLLYATDTRNNHADLRIVERDCFAK
jgi:hypothetical protein